MIVIQKELMKNLSKISFLFMNCLVITPIPSEIFPIYLPQMYLVKNTPLPEDAAVIGE